MPTLANHPPFDFGLAARQPPRGRDSVGPLLLFAAACLAIIVFLPPEGRVAGPLHGAIDLLLGRAAFVLPLAIALAGVVWLARSRRPGLRLPVRRLVGLGLMLAGVLVAERLLAGAGEDDGGLLGAWLTSVLVDALGTVLTGVFVLGTLAFGTAMAFGLSLRLPRRSPPADAEG